VSRNSWSNPAADTTSPTETACNQMPSAAVA
jgi:hypothetical protein